MKNSVAAMLIPDRNVRNAGQSFTVLADVQQMHTMRQVLSEVFMNRDANFSERLQLQLLLCARRPAQPPVPRPPACLLFFLSVSLAFAPGQSWTCSHSNPREGLYPPHCLPSSLFPGYTKQHQKKPDSLSNTSISSSLLRQLTQTLHP